ncbi:O-fucosyltransferase family protein [Tasmannia lanceolata]|uniref:O-fucosyltransferase family protein n=1 Tax=Tasmannia lanceolata TaxID=3420 RepID=UPI004062AB3A
MARSKNYKNSFISITPSHFFYYPSPSSSNCLLFFSKKSFRQSNNNNNHNTSPNSPLLLFLLLFILFSAISIISILQHSEECSMVPSSSFNVPSFSSSPLFLSPLSKILSNYNKPHFSGSFMAPLPVHKLSENMTSEEREFWRQPDGSGYRPCLRFSIDYRKPSARIVKEKRKFLMAVVSGGLNQQRNQIVDVVVIARILEAALVMPILQVNQIWEDESEFSEIFDAEHFKRTLQSDVRIVTSLPSRHLILNPAAESRIPVDVSPLWIRTRFLKQLNQDGVLLLKGLDSKLSKNLPLDLQKLRCKVAFHALRFASPIEEVGNRLARRMWTKGPYMALHLRLEKDVWVRTGCLPGLGFEYDNIITKDREFQPELLTGKMNMSYHRRKLAGLCPLNGLEVAIMLKALGAPRNARVYLAGGEPFGGERALQALKGEFPNMINKEMLASKGELAPFASRSSALAAIDYIVSLNSDVFIPSHGGNMGRVMQGHRAYAGHKKYIRPNKRGMLPLFMDTSLSDVKFRIAMKQLHKESVGQPELRTKKRGRDVIAYPVPECMCVPRSYFF